MWVTGDVSFQEGKDGVEFKVGPVESMFRLTLDCLHTLPLPELILSTSYACVIIYRAVTVLVFAFFVSHSSSTMVVDSTH